MNNLTDRQGDTGGEGSFENYPHLKFRPDIEGLRACAILIVIACHAGIPWMQGGFIGVDIFFVLSGYLISGLLVKEINASGKINFLYFYSRRLKRLLPALIIMTLGTALLAAIILAPVEQVEQAYTLRWVPLWITNLAFTFSDLNYFSFNAKSNLFLHTWSLAIEEQFYLVWPVFIWAVYRGMGDKIKLAFNNQMTRYLIVVFFLFLFLCIFLSYIKPLWAFYLMPSRSWQFALGALTFIFSNKEVAHRTKNFFNFPKAHTCAGWAGLILVITGILYLDEYVIYPGLAALYPSIGAALLIYSGSSQENTLLSRLLSTKPMQFVGKLSYSWYLWHWPILVLGGIIFVEPGVLIQLGLVLLSFAFAVVTMIMIEIPLRTNQTLIQRPILTICLSLIIMTAGFQAGQFWQLQAASWTQTPQQRIYEEVILDGPIIYPNCDDWYKNAIVKPCTFGNQDADKTAVLFGDSVGAQWFSGLAFPLIKKGWRFVVLTKSACPIVDEPYFYLLIGSEYTVCSDWRKLSMLKIMALEPDIIYMGSSAEYDFTQRQWLEGTHRIIEQLSSFSEKIYIIPGSYRLPFDGPLCLARKDWQPQLLSDINKCSSSAGSSLDKNLLSIFNIVANEYENVGVLDFNPLICPENQCASQIGDRIVYRDYLHIASSYVESITLDMIKKIENVRFHANSIEPDLFSTE